VTNDDGSGGRLAALAVDLDRRGVFSDPAWRTAFLRVQRHRFLPDVLWAPYAAADDEWVPVGRDDPYWWANAYVDTSVVTQVDDGRPAGPAGRGLVPTSSASQPSRVIAMLQALAVEDGMSVLEIGTATGYNAALLCERLGDDRVTTVEVDPVLAEQGRANLRAAGYRPHGVVGDGAAGVPDRAPFDRVLATVAARDIPAAWVTQTRPGGLIVTPWGTAWARTALLRLEVAAHGAAHGRVIGEAAFMWLRDQRVAEGDLDDFVDEAAPGVEEFRTSLDPMPICDADPSGGLVLMLGAVAPTLSFARYRAADGSGEASVYFYDRGGSWVLIEFKPDADTFEARRFGPRDLSAAIAGAYEAWWDAGCPGRDRLGVSVTADGATSLWVDSPGNAVV
jgi:protein-L-isoaspartate O-methyltransferase